MKFFIFLILLVLVSSLSADVRVREEETQKAILDLHTRQGPAKENIIWSECGKRLRGEKALERAGQYAQAIMKSVDLVQAQTGEYINPDYMVAILYRESSCNECVIGRQETKKLTESLGREPDKQEILTHVRARTDAYNSIVKKCKERGKSLDIGCLDKWITKKHPEYKGIYGWDLGAPQYRWPGHAFRRRSIVLPSGRTLEKIGLKDIFDYEVSIHMLAEDMARYKQECRTHSHWLYSKWGKKLRQLDTEEAYFAHHHTGTGVWSERYWKAVNKHLRVIRESRHGDLLAGVPGAGDVAMNP